MPRFPLACIVAIATLAPAAASAQGNSIMRSFHPEKYETKDAAKGNEATKADADKGASASPSKEQAAPTAEGK